MRTNRSAFFLVFLTAIFLTACSGVPNGSGGGGGGNQNATLVLTLTSSPSLNLANVSLVSASAGITGITLNPSSGTAVSVTLTPTVYPVDLTRLQADTTLLGSVSIPAGNYTSASITFTAPVLTILNNTGVTLNSTCATGNLCQIVLPAGSAQITASPFPLTLASSQQKGLSLNLNLNRALTLSSGALAINFSATNALSATALPRVGTTSGLDLVEDFVGRVTAITSSAVTVQASDGISQQFLLPASPVIEDPQNLCPALNLTCLVANQTLVSINATVNSAGTLTMVSADLLDTTPRDELEGTLISNGTVGQFFLVVSDKAVTTGNTTLAAAKPGDIFLVTLNNPAFLVDTGAFFNNPSLPSSTVTDLFTSENSLENGQDVMVHVTAASGSAAGNDQSATADEVRLRFTRTTGVVASVSGQSFALTNASMPLLFSFSGNPTVETIPSSTNFDGVTDVNSLAAGNIVSVRALLLKNAAFNFYAVKVRMQATQLLP